MFAFTFSSGREGGGGGQYGFYFAPLVTFVPLFFSLLNMGEFSVIGKGIGLLALGACLLLTLRAVAGDALTNVLDNFLQLFVSAPSGSFFQRDAFGLRRRRGRGRGADGDRAKRFDKVAEALQKLDTYSYLDREALSKLSVAELKTRLRRASLAKGARDEVSRSRRKGLLIEKSELVQKILDESGTSNQMCAICYCDYTNGDVQRELACGHRFHIECVDQWILKAARDYSRPPACPMCNEPVK